MSGRRRGILPFALFCACGFAATQWEMPALPGQTLFVAFPTRSLSSMASRSLLSSSRLPPSTRSSSRISMLGVTREVISEGDGKTFPNPGDTVTMHYKGNLAGFPWSQFDSSYERNEPFVTKIGAGQVIKGWDEAVPKMSLGEKAVLTITSDYAYGERGFADSIPPNSDLKFEVELLKIEGPPPFLGLFR